MIEAGDIILGFAVLTHGWLFVGVPIALVLLMLLAAYLEAGTRVRLYCERHGLRCPTWADPR